MDKKLFVALIIFFAFILFFIIFILKSEYKNMDELKIKYPDIPEEAYLYRKTNLKIWAINLFLSFLIPLIFLTTKLSSNIRSFAESKAHSGFFVIFLYIAVYLFIDLVISIPLSYYSSFVIKHRFGLSNQTMA